MPGDWDKVLHGICVVVAADPVAVPPGSGSGGGPLPGGSNGGGVGSSMGPLGGMLTGGFGSVLTCAPFSALLHHQLVLHFLIE